MDAPKEHVSDEPFPGWLKVEVEGQKPFYKTPFPRTIIRSGAMLKEYLAREQLAGRMDDVEIDKFSFKRKQAELRVPHSKSKFSVPNQLF